MYNNIGFIRNYKTKGTDSMRLLKCLIIICVCLLIPVGCHYDTVSFSPTEIANNIKAFSDDSVEWTTLGEDSVSNHFGFQGDKLKSFTGYISTSEERYDIIAIFEYDEEEIKSEIIKGIDFLLAEAQQNYKAASINQYEKITHKIVAQKDKMIILCITDQTEKVSKYLTEDLLAQIIL